MTDEEREIMVEADDEDELRAFAAQDPVLTTGTAGSRSATCSPASSAPG